MRWENEEQSLEPSVTELYEKEARLVADLAALDERAQLQADDTIVAAYKAERAEKAARLAAVREKLSSLKTRLKESFAKTRNAIADLTWLIPCGDQFPDLRDAAHAELRRR